VRRSEIECRDLGLRGVPQALACSLFPQAASTDRSSFQLACRARPPETGSFASPTLWTKGDGIPLLGRFRPTA